ncbi:MAG: hypothetical protein FWG66_04955 [Spirochaetes bacterium]|nr:hypothetical protein [Spirochaetota bacterium]
MENTTIVSDLLSRDLTSRDLLSRKETARFIGICLTTLDRLDIPKTRVRHRVFYKRDVLNKWIDRQTESVKKGTK